MKIPSLFKTVNLFIKFGTQNFIFSENDLALCTFFMKHTSHEMKLLTTSNIWNSLL